MTQKGLISIIFIFISVCSYGQSESWTLESCIRRAWDSNLTLQMEENNTSRSLYNKREAFFNLLPNFNTNHRVNYNFNHLEEEFDDTFGPMYNSNHSINSSVVLFGGFRKLNFYKATIYLHKASETNYVYEKQQIAILITKIWYDLLLKSELINVAIERVKTAKKQYEYTESLVEVGRLESASILDAEASVSIAELELQKTKNIQNQIALKLQQILELDYSQSFHIALNIEEVPFPQSLTYSIEEVFKLASEHYKSIKRFEFELTAQEYQFKSDKGHYFPTVYANAGFSTELFKQNNSSGMQYTTISSTNKTNPYLGIQVNIPLFNGFSQKYSMKHSRLDLENATLKLKNEKRAIYKELEHAIQQLEAQYKAYITANQSLKYNKRAFENMQERYRLGIANITDVMLAEDRYLKAQFDLLSNKYEWIVQRKLIDFYTGESVL